MSRSLAKKITGKNYPKWKERNNQYCGFARMVDIGVYNACNHLCKYCYANFDESKIEENINSHYPDSSLLIGYLGEDDEIKIRKS